MNLEMTIKYYRPEESTIKRTIEDVQDGSLIFLGSSEESRNINIDMDVVGAHPYLPGEYEEYEGIPSHMIRANILDMMRFDGFMNENIYHVTAELAFRKQEDYLGVARHMASQQLWTIDNDIVGFNPDYLQLKSQQSLRACNGLISIEAVLKDSKEIGNANERKVVHEEPLYLKPGEFKSMYGYPGRISLANFNVGNKNDGWKGWSKIFTNEYEVRFKNSQPEIMGELFQMMLDPEKNPLEDNKGNILAEQAKYNTYLRQIGQY